MIMPLFSTVILNILNWVGAKIHIVILYLYPPNKFKVYNMTQYLLTRKALDGKMY